MGEAELREARNATAWTCPPAPAGALAGAWRLFFDTGAVRGLLLIAAPGGLSAAATRATSGPTLPEARVERSYAAAGFTELVPSLAVPAILGFESSDDEPPVRRYRVRGRFCAREGTALLDVLDLTEGAREGGLRWALRRAVGVRGAAALDVPLVAPARSLRQLFEALWRMGAWSPLELLAAVGAGGPGDGGVALALASGVLQPLRLQRASWRQRLDAPAGAAASAGVPRAVLASQRAPAALAWAALRPGGALVGPCSGPTGGHSPERQPRARLATFGAPGPGGTGLAAFGTRSFWLLLKGREGEEVATGPLAASCGSRGVVLPVLKTLGPAEVGVRLGNALFVVAAAIALAADHGMAMRLSTSASWARYLHDDEAILSTLPTSLWLTRHTDVDFIVGSPTHMGYEAPEIPPGATTIMVHGYFQNPRYFAHRLGLVRAWLTPPAALAAARAALAPGLGAAPTALRVAVHVRLGDRAGLGARFYRVAVRAAERRLRAPPSGVECLFFSDDQAALVQTGLPAAACPPPRRTAVFDPGGGARDDVALLAMGTCCAGVVLSASTFGWWAAVLGAPAVVVAPRTGCGPTAENFTLGAMPGWTRLPVTCPSAASRALRH